jgi:hypothetical protein
MEMITTRKKEVLNTVVTFGGNTVVRDKAVRISGQYYEKHKECVYLPPLANEKSKSNWFRLDHPSISYNYDTKSYDKITRMRANGLVEGFIDTHTKAFFTLNALKHPVLFSDSKSTIPVYALTKQIAIDLGYIEDIATGKYYDKANLSKNDIRVITTKRKVDYRDLSLNYHANNNNSSYVKILAAHNEYLKIIEPTHESLRIAEMLNNLSWGVEFETSNGTVPTGIISNLGLVPLRDGSVSGFEFTTVPLSGAKGLTVMKDMCEELTNRCCINLSCSLHVHLGNIPRERKHALAFIKLGYLIQDDVFNMVPSYKKDPRNRVEELANKEKDYCKKLPSFKFFTTNIDTSNSDTVYTKFQEVFKFLNQSNNDGASIQNVENDYYNFDTRRSPIEAKWNQYGRYYWLSIFPYVFNNSGTVEMRLHQPTLNFHKTINWLLINAAIINYVIYNTDKILKKDFTITLNDIVSSYKTLFDQKENESEVNDPFRVSVTDYLLAYIKDRTDKYSKEESKGIYIDRGELENDGLYRFEYNGIKDLY